MLMWISILALIGATALAVWKRLWVALGVLGVILFGSAYLARTVDLQTGLLVFLGGLFFLYPVAVYLNDERRRKGERRKTIRRSRRRTGRDVP